MNFSSHKEATFDEKGRVVLPAEYKNEMGGSIPGGQLAVEKDPYEKCLNIYTMDEWEKRIAQITSKLNRDNREQSRLLDMFYRNFKIIQVPENCRMNFPNNFLEIVGISKEVMFTGQGSRIRLWDLSEYGSYALSDEDYANAFDRLVGGNEEN
jgi:MraZ protein